MAKVEHASDARVLVGIDISKHRHEVLIAVPGKTRRRPMTEADRFHRSTRGDWFLAFLEAFPSPHMITAMDKDAFIAAAWPVIGRRSASFWRRGAASSSSATPSRSVPQSFSTTIPTVTSCARSLASAIWARHSRAKSSTTART